MMRAITVSLAARVTRARSPPWPFIVPANTSAPVPLWTGVASPVIDAWFTSELPSITSPSAGIRSPGLMITRSPMTSSSIATRRSAPLRTTTA